MRGFEDEGELDEDERELDEDGELEDVVRGLELVVLVLGFRAGGFFFFLSSPLARAARSLTSPGSAAVSKPSGGAAAATLEPSSARITVRGLANFMADLHRVDREDERRRRLFDPINTLTALGPRPVVLALGCLGGCGPGSLTWGEETEPLRSAFFISGDVSSELLLSNGDFECDLPDGDAPEVDAALQGWRTAGCREGARHFYAVFPGRLESGVYLEDDGDFVHFAFSVEETTTEHEWELGWSYVHVATEMEQLVDQEGGSATMTRKDDLLSGQIHVPGLDTHFRATRCPVGAQLFTLVGSGVLNPTSCIAGW